MGSVAKLSLGKHLSKQPFEKWRSKSLEFFVDHYSDVTLRIQEEAGIIAPLEKCGTLFFVAENSEQAFHIDIFVAEEYKGSVTE